MAVEVSELTKLTREQLNDLASQHNVEGAENLPNKEEVAKQLAPVVGQEHLEQYNAAPGAVTQDPTTPTTEGDTTEIPSIQNPPVGTGESQPTDEGDVHGTQEPVDQTTEEINNEPGGLAEPPAPTEADNTAGPVNPDDSGEGGLAEPQAPTDANELAEADKELKQQVGGTASNIGQDGTVDTRTTDPNVTESVDQEETNDLTQVDEKPGGSNVTFAQNEQVLLTRNNRTDRATVVAQHGDKVEVVVGTNPEVHTVWAAQLKKA
jgi:hypothetical protein